MRVTFGDENAGIRYRLHLSHSSGSNARCHDFFAFTDFLNAFFPLMALLSAFSSGCWAFQGFAATLIR